MKSKLLLLGLLMFFALSANVTAAGVDILSTNNYIENDYLVLVGEVINNTDQPQGSIKIIGSFYNSNGDIIISETTYSELDVISPDTTSPFKIMVEYDTDISRYTLQVQSQPDSLPDHSVEILSSNTKIEYDYLILYGEVKNTGSSPVESIKVAATFYDSNNDIIDLGTTYTEKSTLSPGETSPFKISVKNRPSINNFKLQVH